MDNIWLLRWHRGKIVVVTNISSNSIKINVYFFHETRWAIKTTSSNFYKNKNFVLIYTFSLLYGSEAWPVLERHKQSLRVTEMNMLRWMSGVSRKDRTKNSRIQGSLQVRDIADKLQEGRLRWYGHVLRKLCAKCATWVTDASPCRLRRDPKNEVGLRGVGSTS
ncbi:hypothetical protein PYW08_003014 [Mythimna loreyi]|uniref:Uncharacterized protein n=1 Tax=Mythimna loreyi TaxID=667449 RepID=A0ACC2QQZ3_9NEOP|nr:hypothetical protein PYW08_003014 [Mythimna loreyi]